MISVEKRFMRKVRQSRNCWQWTGAVQSSGYGCFSIAGKRCLAHRCAYEMFVGPIPETLHVDHLCRNRLCVRPQHLEPVTVRVNNQRVTGYPLTAWPSQLFGPPVLARVEIRNITGARGPTQYATAWTYQAA